MPKKRNDADISDKAKSWDHDQMLVDAVTQQAQLESQSQRLSRDRAVTENAHHDAEIARIKKLLNKSKEGSTNG